MSTLAQTVESSVSELEKLNKNGMISEELTHHLLAVLKISRTGRIFGHDSACVFPERILEMTEACSSMLNETGCSVEEIRETVSRKFAVRARRPTELNRIIASVVDEINHRPNSEELSEIAPTQRNWLTSLFSRKKFSLP